MQKCKKCRVNLKKNWHNKKGEQRLICPKCGKTVSEETVVKKVEKKVKKPTLKEYRENVLVELEKELKELNKEKEVLELEIKIAKIRADKNTTLTISWYGATTISYWNQLCPNT